MKNTETMVLRLTEAEFDTLVAIVYEQINAKTLDEEFDIAEALLALARALSGKRRP